MWAWRKQISQHLIAVITFNLYRSLKMIMQQLENNPQLLFK